jgi:acyl carrier protein phosphodiesterase
MHTNLEIRLRLNEIVRRSAELSATRSVLCDMASQLTRLRKLNGSTGLLTERKSLARISKSAVFPYGRHRRN